MQVFGLGLDLSLRLGCRHRPPESAIQDSGCGMLGFQASGPMLEACGACHGFKSTHLIVKFCGCGRGLPQNFRAQRLAVPRASWVEGFCCLVLSFSTSGCASFRSNFWVLGLLCDFELREQYIRLIAQREMALSWPFLSSMISNIIITAILSHASLFNITTVPPTLHR